MLLNDRIAIEAGEIIKDMKGGWLIKWGLWQEVWALIEQIPNKQESNELELPPALYEITMRFSEDFKKFPKIFRVMWEKTYFVPYKLPFMNKNKVTCFIKRGENV